MAKPKQPKTAASKKSSGKGSRRTDTPETGPLFPIVGIGVSAGGLEALEQFFTHLSPDSGMAFVVIQHLDPNHKSILDDLVKRYTRMNVYQVQDGMAVEPNCVYVIPPNRDLTVMAGSLQLLEPVTPRGLRMPIDTFMHGMSRSLADLRLAAHDANPALVASHSHALRGTCALMGTERAGSLLETLELQSNQGNLESAGTLLGQLAEELERIGGVLGAEKSRHSGDVP